ncbi:DUF3047 domain-containing protein [Candidatus Nitronereus thalassa]|uniref:DUF3047 domain-containing protein n=1 Tax=Candidatus Nitronereus thalassa TaxID=3020898 RepID=A0ABU3KDD8_9BACT|nr:DUF3047 domain-containing protein [Candidatus Nitronereus thalassa]MDT7044237.1 DUF3047 domain-containing protein [Candidatus Nitronereus thalassa]
MSDLHRYSPQPLSIFGFFLCLISTLWLPSAIAEEKLEIGLFSSAEPEGSFPQGWEPLTFEKIPQHTAYELVKDGGTVVVKATSKQSSSGLTRKMKIDPKQFPIVQWRWKIENIIQGSDVTKKEGDDYPARIYITFEYDSSKVGFFEKAKFELIRLAYGQYPPTGAINYIWESKAPIGAVVPNPYTDYVQMIVTQSGSQRVGEWVMEEHNVYEDYKKAFGEEPTHISGVAIMTDTDNTKESAIAYFGDILFKQSATSE